MEVVPGVPSKGLQDHFSPFASSLDAAVTARCLAKVWTKDHIAHLKMSTIGTIPTNAVEAISTLVGCTDKFSGGVIPLAAQHMIMRLVIRLESHHGLTE